MIELPLYLKLSQVTFHGMQEQERTGICFDKCAAESLVQDLTLKMEAIESEVEPKLPSRAPLKSEIGAMTPPKKQFKKDGTPSALCLKWFDDVVFSDGMGTEVPKDDTCGLYMGLKSGNWYVLPQHEPIIQELK